MSTKIIKFHDSKTTYLPVTDASVVQFNDNGNKKSVQTAISDSTANWNETSSTNLSYIKNKPTPIGGGTAGDGKLVPNYTGTPSNEVVKVLTPEGWKTLTVAHTVEVSYNLKYCESNTHTNVDIQDTTLWGSFADPTVATSVFVGDANVSVED